ncbi:uncharacterized protein DFL_008702 [Arthrobotrys flagrans]|uniref:Uncharacterized protein n=1 Tax=Arthrobotrys flagrans TaxID=97331 RepID=A0A436ZPH8_ARTFL|nr:hypothetical protein DFL_008702 [Arthrobotrys flagrans]
MDRKAQRIETTRMHLRNLIYEQHGEQVNPKEITNTHRSRAPFQFVFKSDDPKQPRVSIASISQPDYDAIMRLIKAGRLRAIRIDDNPDFVGLKQDPDVSQQSPTEIFETGITPSPIESVRQLTFNRRESLNIEEAMAGRFRTGGVLPTLPPFSTIMTHENTLALSPPLHGAQLPSLPHSQSLDNLIPLTSFPTPTAMVIDDPLDSPGSACWSQIHKDIEGLRLGATQWAEELGDVQTRIEVLSKLEKQVGKEGSQVAYSEMEKLKLENVALKLRVKALEKENRDITNERDFLKRLLDRISQHSKDLNDSS